MKTFYVITWLFIGLFLISLAPLKATPLRSISKADFMYHPLPYPKAIKTSMSPHDVLQSPQKQTLQRHQASKKELRQQIKRLRKANKKARGLAIASVVLGGASVVSLAVGIILAAVSAASVLAVVPFAFGLLLGFILAGVGLALGLSALKRFNENPDAKGRSLASLGVVICAGFLAITLLFALGAILSLA